jgi:co-chaperonin GroES (HSP10)
MNIRPEERKSPGGIVIPDTMRSRVSRSAASSVGCEVMPMKFRS